MSERLQNDVDPIETRDWLQAIYFSDTNLKLVRPIDSGQKGVRQGIWPTAKFANQNYLM